MMETLGLFEHTCYRCGKHFEGMQQWAYKLMIGAKGTKFAYFCSYKCKREFETSCKRPPTPRTMEVWELFDKGVPREEIGKKLHISARRLSMYEEDWRANHDSKAVRGMRA